AAGSESGKGTRPGLHQDERRRGHGDAGDAEGGARERAPPRAVMLWVRRGRGGSERGQERDPWERRRRVGREPARREREEDRGRGGKQERHEAGSFEPIPAARQGSGRGRERREPGKGAEERQPDDPPRVAVKVGARGEPAEEASRDEVVEKAR